jgi:hypothetical protein
MKMLASARRPGKAPVAAPLAVSFPAHAEAVWQGDISARKVTLFRAEVTVFAAKATLSPAKVTVPRFFVPGQWSKWSTPFALAPCAGGESVLCRRSPASPIEEKRSWLCARSS